MVALLLVIGKRAGGLARDALHGARVILRSPNLPIYLALTASVCCALGFTVLAAVWWQDMDFIAGGRRDAALRENHLRQVQRAFAEVRFLPAEIRTEQRRKRHGKHRRGFQPVATADGDSDGLLSEAGISKIRNTDDRDSDGDGLFDGEERALGTNPRLRDSDGDGVWDGAEIRLGLDPNAVDSGGDGVKDRDRDNDGDGCSNIEEQRVGYDPGSKNSLPADGSPEFAAGYWGDASMQVSSFSPLGVKVGKRRYVKRALPAPQSPPSVTPASAPPARRER